MINQLDLHAIAINVVWRALDGSIRTSLSAQPCVGFISREVSEFQANRIVDAIKLSREYCEIISVYWTFCNVYGDSLYGSGDLQRVSVPSSSG